MCPIGKYINKIRFLDNKETISKTIICQHVVDIVLINSAGKLQLQNLSLYILTFGIFNNMLT